MKKKRKNILLILMILLAIILFFVIFILNKNNNIENNLNNIYYNEENEKTEFIEKLENIKDSLGFIAILTSVDKYNAGGNYITKKNKNLLEKTSDKQLFVLEQIITNKDNNKNFIILDTSGEKNDEIIDPTEEASTAYYPYNLFINEYNKYFKETFDVENRTKSNLNNIYDNDEKYVYYKNRRTGLNGFSITEITVNNISKISSNKYKANITQSYSERLSNVLELKSENAEIIYIKENNNVKIESYIIK